MHELSLCQAIVDTVNANAGGREVRGVELRVGHLRQVVPDALNFAWEMLTAGTPLDGCELRVDHVPAVLACRACGAVTTLDLPLLVCEACGSDDAELQSGEEFLIVAIEVATGVA